MPKHTDKERAKNKAKEAKRTMVDDQLETLLGRGAARNAAEAIKRRKKLLQSI